jgi:hypothetical protein
MTFGAKSSLLVKADPAADLALTQHKRLTALFRQGLNGSKKPANDKATANIA